MRDTQKKMSKSQRGILNFRLKFHLQAKQRNKDVREAFWGKDVK
jgi:hypothetical protein